MRSIKNKVNIVDIECTCWDINGQPINEISEIIEIGITVVDNIKLEILSTESILVKPEKSKVSEFCTSLTTITQKDVESGISFNDACKLLKTKYKSKDRTWISWGDYDRKMFEKMSKEYTIQYPFGPRHINLKNCFSIFNGNILDKELDLLSMSQFTQIPLTGILHRGDSDSFNIAKFYIHFLNKYRS